MALRIMEESCKQSRRKVFYLPAIRVDFDYCGFNHSMPLTNDAKWAENHTVRRRDASFFMETALFLVIRGASYQKIWNRAKIRMYAL